MLDWFADPGNAAIALAALVVSVIALAVSIRTSRRQTAVMEAQERDRQQAAKRAALRARLERPQCIDELVVENVGAAEARNIGINCDQPLGRKELPFALAPGACWRTSLPNSIPGGPIPSAYVHITWEDDSGEPGEWASDVSRLPVSG